MGAYTRFEFQMTLNQGFAVNPKIGDDIEFEINANFMRELRCKIFAGTNDEDAYKHVRTILEIVNLFHFPSVTHDSIMLKVLSFYSGLDHLHPPKFSTLQSKPVPRNLPPTPFLRHLKEQMGSPYSTLETICMNGNPE
ncbi:hypothetical protein Tco_0675414 [Tanacetum coccineum]